MLDTLKLQLMDRKMLTLTKKTRYDCLCVQQEAAKITHEGDKRMQEIVLEQIDGFFFDPPKFSV